MTTTPTAGASSVSTGTDGPVATSAAPTASPAVAPTPGAEGSEVTLQGAGGPISMPNIDGVGLEGDDNPWAKHGALIVAGSKVEGAAHRKVIVVSTRQREAPAEPDPKHPARDPKESPFKATSYPKGADLYLRSDDTVDFDVKAGTPILTLGHEIQQAGFDGLSTQIGAVNVGPASIVHAGVNLAHQFGARDVKVIGLDDDERERLRPSFDKIAEHFDKLTF